MRGYRVTNRAKTPPERGSSAFYRRKTDYAAELDEQPRGCPNPSSVTAPTGVAGVCAAPLIFSAATALGARLPALRRIFPLFESTKSAMRGAISARKREPLNTP